MEVRMPSDDEWTALASAYNFSEFLRFHLVDVATSGEPPLNDLDCGYAAAYFQAFLNTSGIGVAFCDAASDLYATTRELLPLALRLRRGTTVTPALRAKGDFGAERPKAAIRRFEALRLFTRIPMSRRDVVIRAEDPWTHLRRGK